MVEEEVGAFCVQGGVPFSQLGEGRAEGRREVEAGVARDDDVPLVALRGGAWWGGCGRGEYGGGAVVEMGLVPFWLGFQGLV